MHLKDEDPLETDEKMISELLDELDVPEDLRSELKSGKITPKIIKTENVGVARYKLELDSASGKLRSSPNNYLEISKQLNKLSEHLEVDIVPILLKFYVTLKGELSVAKESILTRARSRAKMSLIKMFIDKDLAYIIDDEFSNIESKSGSEVLEPVLNQVRDVADKLKKSDREIRNNVAEQQRIIEAYIGIVLSVVDDISKLVENTDVVELQKQLREREGVIEALRSEISAKNMQLKAREEEIEKLKAHVNELQARIDDLEKTLTSGEAITPGYVSELREKVRALEASRSLLMSKYEDALKHIEESETEIKELSDALAQKKIELEDSVYRIRSLEKEIEELRNRLSKVTDLEEEIKRLKSRDLTHLLELKEQDLNVMKIQLERASKERDEYKQELDEVKARLERLDLLIERDAKTMSYKVLEKQKRSTIRDLARPLGVSPSTVRIWMNEFQSLGLVKFIDDNTVEIIEDPLNKSEEESKEET